MSLQARTTKQTLALLVVAAAITVGMPTPTMAAEVVQTFEFALDEWQSLDVTDGDVTLHRIRVQRDEGRLTKSIFQRPANQENLQALEIELEYTNGRPRGVEARIEVAWRDEDGVLIDSFTANEDLDRRSARKTTRTTLVTFEYGLSKARQLEVRIVYEL